MGRIKKYIYTLILVLMVIFSIELGVRTIYFLNSKEVISFNILKTEIFNVFGFTVPVNDLRGITMKKNHHFVHESNPSQSKYGTSWSIITNDLGMRVEQDTGEQNELYSSNKKLFIGDSVPFGWGVNAEYSIPALWQKSDLTSTSMNGAVPSYSLMQAVTRLEIEFSHLSNVTSIFLQIYDPVSQYALWGDTWKETYNWTNQRNSLKNNAPCRIINNEFLQTKFKTVVLVNRLAEIYSVCGSRTTFKKFTQESDKRFFQHIRNELQKLKDIANSMNARLFVAPLVFKTGSSIGERRAHAIKLLNETLQYSATKIGYVFVPIHQLMEPEDFIDDCCHLTPTGATKVVSVLRNLNF